MPFGPHDRRRFLRGVGKTTLALPFLEYFLPRGRALAATGQARMIYCYLPNGAQWQPAQTGTDFTLPGVLSDLSSLQDYLTVISGLTLGPAKAQIPGDHSRGQAAYLTGQTCAFPGPSVGTSIDISLANLLGQDTPVSSLCFASEQGNSESGYAADYQSCVSWLGGANANTRDVDPAAVFDRLFGAATSAPQQPTAANAPAAPDAGQSILDAVLAEAKALNRVLGQSDQDRLNDYMQSLRDLETRLSASTAEKAAASSTAAGTTAPMCVTPTRPTSGASYDQRIGFFYDVLYHALACGMTNVATFLLAAESSNQSYEFAGVTGGHHEISHDSSPAGYAKLAQIVQWHVAQLAKFCLRLQQTPDGSGNMLDRTIVMLGGGLADGARHTHDNLPILLLGKGNGALRGHQHLHFEGQPLSNLHLTLAKSLGLNWSSFGDSTGTFGLT